MSFAGPSRHIAAPCEFGRYWCGPDNDGLDLTWDTDAHDPMQTFAYCGGAVDEAKIAGLFIGL
jgi:hypothetical protein